MRWVPMLLLTAALAGCTAVDDPSLQETPPEPAPAPGQNFTYEGLTEFCLDEESCLFWDGQFHEGAVYELDTLELDALVFPVPAPNPVTATAAAGMATARWADVELLAEPWFAEQWELRTYVIGTDQPTAEALTDPEILVISESGQRSTSIGLNAEQLACTIIGSDGQYTSTNDFVDGSLATKVYPVHEHDGMAIFAAECITGGFRCVALNFAGFLGGNNPLYDLVAHEVGHCLGVSHVGDALDFNARYVPVDDIMSYADNPSRVSCVSSLNARTMEGIYAELAGQEPPQWLLDDWYYAMDPWDYHQVECSNPPQ